jgi:phenylacetate-CoA ligase
MLARRAYLALKIREEQWLSPDVLGEIQETRLRKMVHHAYENTQFYRDLFKKCNLKPGDTRTKEDLSMLEPTQNAISKKNSMIYWLQDILIASKSG